MSADTYAALRLRILEAIASWDSFDETAFSDLAFAIHRFQMDANEVYRAYCDAAGAGAPHRWQDIPALPATAFKRAEVRAFPPADTVAVFESSGTTTGAPGRHFFATLELYEAALLAAFRRFMLPDTPSMPMLALTPHPGEAPRSSLVHMIRIVMEQCGGGMHQDDFFIRDDRFLAGELIARLHAAGSAPVMLLGTAFAFAHLLDAMGERDVCVHLPPGSRIMETGGFKGRTRAIPRGEFYAALSARLGVAPTHIVNEYGMSELSSQFYDASLRDGRPDAWKHGPPWARVLAVDPLSGRPVDDGQFGLLRIFDLANLGSVMALQTEDVGVCEGGRFRVMGRVENAEPRGCSLDAEQLRPD